MTEVVTVPQPIPRNLYGAMVMGDRLALNLNAAGIKPATLLTLTKYVSIGKAAAYVRDERSAWALLPAHGSRNAFMKPSIDFSSGIALCRNGLITSYERYGRTNREGQDLGVGRIAVMQPLSSRDAAEVAQIMRGEAFEISAHPHQQLGEYLLDLMKTFAAENVSESSSVVM